MAMTNNGSLVMVQYEGVSTVVPHKPTFSKPSVRILIEKNMESSLFKRSFHMILCYNKASTEYSGWIVAGWAKDSISIALSDQPLLAGRLRRAEDGLAIVANDSGIRFVEARIPMNLEEFIGLRNKEEVQKQLVFWENIDDRCPQFSPLFCIQVTNFKCGAYSIGISCSLLLSDPLSTANFVKKWAKVHIDILNDVKTPKLPLRYLPNIGKSTSSVYNAYHADQKEAIGQSLIFKFPQNNLILDSEMQKTIAVSCIETAIHRSENKVMNSKFSLLMKEPCSDITKISTICVKEENLLESFTVLNGVGIMWADYIDADDIKISEENKPVNLVNWISSPSGEGLAIITSSDLDMTVIVTLPSKMNAI